MRARVLVLFAAVALALTLGVLSARADQITLGDSCQGLLTVSSVPSLSVSGNVSGCFASFESGGTSTGDFTYSIALTFQTPTTASFSISSNGESLAGTVTWTEAAFTSGATLLDGYLFVSSLGSPTDFNSEYVVGQGYYIDLTLLNQSCGEGSCIGRVSSGEIPVPEPGTVTLLGTGVLALAGFLRRKFRS